MTAAVSATLWTLVLLTTLAAVACWPLQAIAVVGAILVAGWIVSVWRIFYDLASRGK